MTTNRLSDTPPSPHEWSIYVTERGPDRYENSEAVCYVIRSVAFQCKWKERP